MIKTTVLGSINMDSSISLERIPMVGETVFGDNISFYGGGKGANQAIACRRMGMDVSFIGKVGEDSNGKILYDRLSNEGINTQYIFKDSNTPTGQAIICVDKDGQNNIIVIPGTNMAISEEEIIQCEEEIKNSNIILSQFEVPMEAIAKAFKIAKDNNVLTVLNPAPVKEITDELVNLTDIIIPNEVEMFKLTGVEINNLEDAKKASRGFMDKGIKYVIITLGKKGCAVVSKENACIIPTFDCKVVDTTAAGDSFIGGFLSKLSDINDFEVIKKCGFFAIYVSTLVVQKHGAQESIPYYQDIEKGFMEYYSSNAY